MYFWSCSRRVSPQINGLVAKSAPFTRVGSQVQSLSRPPSLMASCDRRVAQWQSAPTTWERSGVRFPFAPTKPCALCAPHAKFTAVSDQPADLLLEHLRSILDRDQATSGSVKASTPTCRAGSIDWRAASPPGNPGPISSTLYPSPPPPPE